MVPIGTLFIASAGMLRFIANNILHIESANEPIDHACILDLNGKTLIRQSLKKDNSVVNITDLSAGIYIVKVICNDRTEVGKFVKTN